MEVRRILETITAGESINAEFKESRNFISGNVYETVCAFLNRQGGTLLLGVTDSKVIQGVEHNSIEQLRKDFINTINNPQKINPIIYLSIDVININDKEILYVYAPESSQVHRRIGKIYDRNEDGDFDITNNTLQVSAMCQRNQTTYTENRIFPFASIDDLDSALLAKCRKTATIRRADHHWQDLDDMELLRSSGLYKKDREISGEIAPPIVDKKITKLEKKLLEFLQNNSKASRKNISSALGISISSVKEYIERLKDKKLLGRIGNNRSGWWNVKK